MCKRNVSRNPFFFLHFCFCLHYFPVNPLIFSILLTESPRIKCIRNDFSLFHYVSKNPLNHFVSTYTEKRVSAYVRNPVVIPVGLSSSCQCPHTYHFHFIYILPFNKLDGFIQQSNTLSTFDNETYSREYTQTFFTV